MSDSPKKRWYVIQAFSGFEGRVAQSLREHIKLHMEDSFGEVMVPTEEVVEIRSGQRRRVNVNSSQLCLSQMVE